MYQRESRNLGKKKLEMLCDKILRVVHLDQRFRVNLRLMKSRIHCDVLSNPSTYKSNSDSFGRNNVLIKIIEIVLLQNFFYIELVKIYLYYNIITCKICFYDTIQQM